MTTPDRVALLAAQDAWARSQQAPAAPEEDSRDHVGEMSASHLGQPSEAVLDKTSGMGLPPVDRGTDDHAKYA